MTFPAEIRVFEIGGCVRDELLGIPSKDIDFAVEAESFDHMRSVLLDLGFTIHIEKPEFLTIRAKFPKTWDVAVRDVDFVLCRRDSETGDGRRPDQVFAGTLLEDQQRRDFTVNSIAREFGTDELIDPFDGITDLLNRRLRFVGDPFERIEEDGLRVLRGIRFTITKGFRMTPETRAAINSPLAAVMLRCVATDRKREELSKMFTHSTVNSIATIANLPAVTVGAIFTDDLRLDATQKA